MMNKVLFGLWKLFRFLFIVFTFNNINITLFSLYFLFLKFYIRNYENFPLLYFLYKILKIGNKIKIR